ncbi:MAG: hypothetical protein VYE73_05795 [Acidobacteriota bacterium]|nr:hypothetical protein [Acidobacteriota bacterium]
MSLTWDGAKAPTLLQQLLLDRMTDHWGNLFRLLSILLVDTEAAVAFEQLYPLVSRVAARPGSTLVRKTAQWILDRWGAREPLAEPGR